MIIRHATLEDWEEIVAIEQENFSQAEAATPEDMRSRITTISDTFLVAEVDGKLAGYVVGPAVNQRYLTDDLFHEVVPNPSAGGYIALTSLSVNPTFQNQGIGTALLAAMKDLAIAQEREGISLTCHDYLIAYYERNGFLDEGESESSHGGASWYNLVWDASETSLRVF
ncbi:GNAT family N-acetyltransferase [Streptococcus saliviloxodontae]|uniref:Ribosomal protein S18 acetylase RimI-like enzyme n=1 Tax=Streptococcus saliviloxodontae TaxID=1349416 RepID=A0ABS2PKU3_9STRE|nr:GNAT family N-acetyltransferase [Streptococcus saliviloxodontae]MBM7635605.1 ribosomal protein S18 acetylase RimI-like enzyme [Streptococcus saliviloxodontae]